MTNLARRPNRLVHARSPYLRQHAHNPVDWYPWGEEALRRARAEDKPIFLSIGYSSCHWCHVMERESFEDEELARLLNERFVPVKVDREERPDLDMLYQRAAQVAGVAGGWPLSVFLTPDQKPFWIATYIPPEDRWGLPGFGRVLEALSRAWRERRDEVERAADRFVEALARLDAGADPGAVAVPAGPGDGAEALRAGLVTDAAALLLRHVDWRHGGLGARPKFPNASALELFLRAALRAGWSDEVGAACRRALLLTLRRMALGGIYDQLGGGFHRYAVDQAWLVPHFEKMLYDNAQLVPLYVAALPLADDPADRALFRRVARETVAYVAREMVIPEGAFASAQDADSEGEEGRFFVWTPAELAAVLGPEDAALAAEYFGVTQEGNFEGGRSVLHGAASVEELAARRGADAAELASRLDAIRRRLFEARERRPRPATDDKVLAGWNGLMIGGLARAGLGLAWDEPVALAARAADLLLARLCREDGSLWRVYKDGEAYVPGFLEDYAYLAAGLLDLYQATFERRYLDAALRLTDAALERFWDDAEGDFLFVPRDGESLVHRLRDAADTATPSAGAIMAHNLVLLDAFRGDGGRAALVERLFARHRVSMQRDPFAFASWILAWDLHANAPVELALAGDEDAVLLDWARRAAGLPVPGLLLTRVPAGADTAGSAPIWAGRKAVDGRPTAYVCRQRACSAPLTDWGAVERTLLAGLPR